jgi:hypothetical protein
MVNVIVVTLPVETLQQEPRERKLEQADKHRIVPSSNGYVMGCTQELLEQPVHHLVLDLEMCPTQQIDVISCAPHPSADYKTFETRGSMFTVRSGT